MQDKIKMPVCNFDRIATNHKKQQNTLCLQQFRVIRDHLTQNAWQQ